MSVKTYTADKNNKVEGITTQYKTAGSRTIMISNNLASMNALKNQGVDALKVKSVVLGENIKQIESGCFKDCIGLQSLHLNSKITKIASQAFYNCRSLQKVDLPNSVFEIQSQAFYGNASLREVTFPANEVKVESSCFENCTSLAAIDARFTSDSGTRLFYGCSSLVAASIAGLASANMLAYCTSLATCYLMQITSIGESCFQGCNRLATIDFPSNITSIGARAFSGCAALANLDLSGTKIAYLAEEVISGTSIATLKLPTAINDLSKLAARCLAGSSVTAVYLNGFTNEYMKANKDHFNRFGASHNMDFYSSSGKKWKLNSNGIGLKVDEVYVLSVGHTGGNLTGMWNDIKWLRTMIEKQYGSDFQNITYHKLGDGGEATESATKENVEKYLQDAVDMQPSLFIFHFSDHGSSSGSIVLTSGSMSNSTLFNYFCQLPRVFGMFCCCYPWKGAPAKANTSAKTVSSKKLLQAASDPIEDPNMSIGDQFLKFMELRKQRLAKAAKGKLLAAGAANDPEVLIWGAGKTNQVTYMSFGTGHYFMQAIYRTFSEANTWRQQWNAAQKTSWWSYECEGQTVVPQKTVYNNFDEGAKVFM